MSKLSKVEQAINTLEDAAQKKSLSESQLSRIASLAGLAEGTRPAVEGALSAAEKVIPKSYREQYDRLPNNVKERCDWETVSAKLLANDGEKLKKAEAMQGGGELFGVDAEGMALFKDKGVEPVMFGFDEDDKLMKIYDRDPEQMEKVAEWADYYKIRRQVRADGYELFSLDPNSDNRNSEFGDEMRQVEAHTKEPFVASEGKKEWRGSWTESGDRPSDAYHVDFDPDGGHMYVHEHVPVHSDDYLGVVRLLRV
jgi:hypothetical protein